MLVKRQKKTLSPHGVLEANFYVECLAEDIDFGMKITLDQFEELVSPLLDRLVPPIEEALRITSTNSKITPDTPSPHDLSAVEIIGGGTRVASVKRKIAETLGIAQGASPPNWGLQTTLNADESTAKGCALAAAMLSPRFKVKEYAVVDAVPHSVVLSWDKPQMSISNAVPEDDEEDKDDTSNNDSATLFIRNEATPMLRRITFRRTDVFAIRANYAVEESSLLPPGDDRAIGTFVLNIPEAIGKDSPEKIRKIRVHVNHTLSGTVKVESAEVALLPEETAPESEAADSKDAMDTTPIAPDSEQAQDNAANDSKEPTAASETSPDKDTEMKDAPPALSKESGEADAASSKKKPKYKRKPITVETTIIGKMDQRALDAAIETEARMANADRVITETNDMRNDLEAFIYRMRDAILDDLAPFIPESDKSSLDKSLQDAEMWLYEGDGFDTTKSAYQNYLQTLGSKFAGAEARKKEDNMRPELVASFQKKIEQFKQWANSIDENYAHIPDTEKTKVRDAAETQSSWLLDMLDKQGSLAPSEDPVLKCADLQARITETEKLANPIINTPKPKPAPAPAADTSTAESKPSENEVPAGEKSDGNPKPEDKDVDMPDASEGEQVPDADMPDAPPPS
mmetsp:Transcript_2976/g.3865  ORF Transcript_2976/g.3865 Transcript_2976/m.3865 type:complete len:629 (+) Transcript_2976:1018-2904(+)